LKTLRAAVVNNEVYAHTDKAWVLDTPYDVRDEAIRDLVKAYASNFAKKEKQTDLKFQLRFKSKKQGLPDSLLLHGKHMHIDIKDDQRKSISMFSTFFTRKVGSLKCAESLPLDFNAYDCRLVKERTGRFYLHLPRPLEHQYERTKRVADHLHPDQQTLVVALDPGVRTFMTGYSPSGDVLELGQTADMEQLRACCLRIDAIQSLCSNEHVKARTRYNLKRRSQKLQQAIKNRRSDFHRKMAKLLVSRFGTILLPVFKTSRMVDNQDHKRKINSKTARNMLTWSHYTFQQLLVNKAREVPGCRVLIVDEAHTTKTCGKCGTLNEVGGAKEWTCRACQVRVHRDWCAARNIFFKNCHFV
jgi:putative transposase